MTIATTAIVETAIVKFSDCAIVDNSEGEVWLGSSSCEDGAGLLARALTHKAMSVIPVLLNSTASIRYFGEANLKSEEKKRSTRVLKKKLGEDILTSLLI